MTCPKCGTEHESNFCPNCGTAAQPRLIKCSKCGAEYISKFCPNCGSSESPQSLSQSQEFEKATKKASKPRGGCLKFVAIGVAVVVVLGIIGSMGGSENPENPSTPSVSMGTEKEPTPTPPAKVEEENSDWIKAGMYKVGTDIPAGEYLVFEENGFIDMCYYEVTRDSSGSFDSIISNDNITSHAYVTVYDGEYITVKYGKLIPVDKTEPFEPVNGQYSDGQYKVGRDILPGEYKIKGGAMCYLEVTANSRGTFDGIITNEILESDTEQYITISDGQYITVKGGVIIVG